MNPDPKYVTHDIAKNTKLQETGDEELEADLSIEVSNVKESSYNRV